MKKLIVLTLFSILFYTEASAARLRLPYCSDCQYIEHVADLPDSADFYSEEYKSYADIGFMYNQLWALWIPIWNSEGKYVLTIKDQDVFFDITPEELEAYQKAYNLDLPSNPIPLWDKIGGKVILILLAAGIFWAYFGKSKADDPQGKKEEFLPSRG
jgi:hypothetical protein